MNFLDRVTFENGYIEACDREPIHIPGSIQPHGALLAFEPNAGKLAFASQNLWQFLGMPRRDLNSMSFADFAGVAEDGDCLFTSVLNIAKVNTACRVPIQLPGVLRFFKVEMHLSKDNFLVLEIESSKVTSDGMPLLEASVQEKLQFKQLLETLDGDHSLQESMEAIASRVRKLTKYDRVMIYKFDKFGNGEVLVDDHREDLESFQGLHYPASDIPRQARELYLANRVRHLVDTRSTPVKLVAIGLENGLTPTLDMSYCGLRSFSPIHLQYLENMGVRSSLAISVVLDGQLWGLIIAHHLTSKSTSNDMRMQCDLYSHILSTAIQSAERRQQKTDVLESQNCYVDIEIAAKKTRDWKNYLFQESHVLLDLLAACGVLWSCEGARRSLGRLPNETILEAIAKLTSELCVHEALVAEDWHRAIPGIHSIESNIAGFTAVCISKSPLSYVVWFRESMSKTVVWGGNPTKRVDACEGSDTLSPRKSFEKWQQDVSGVCPTWTEQDVLRAKAIGLFLGVKQTEEANLVKSRFLTNMSHELRTPMTAILGYADVLMEQLPEQDVECRGAAEIICRSGKHLLAMLNDLLDIAKVESGKLSFVLDSIDVKELFRETLEVFATSARSKNIRLSIDYEPSLPINVRSDPVRMKQVVFNLLSNAIKFTQNGTVSVTVHYVPMGNSNKGKLVVKVKDSGIGMSPEVLSRIFRPFEQADDSLSRKYGGTGLGLSISRYLAEGMGGSLSAESILGSGSTFSAEFCVERVADSAHASAAMRPTETQNVHAILGVQTTHTEEAPPKQQIEAARSIRILLAEDGPDNQRLIRWMLERKFGAQVTLVDDGTKAVKQALAAENEKPYDLVLMDIQMPILDGLAATRQLREQNFSRPIIAISAHASTADIDLSLEAGCNTHIPKPVDWAQLKNVIQEHCRSFASLAQS